MNAKKISLKNLSFELDFLSIRLEVSAFWKRTKERKRQEKYTDRRQERKRKYKDRPIDGKKRLKRSNKSEGTKNNDKN